MFEKVKFSTVFHKRGCIFEDEPTPLVGEADVYGTVVVDDTTCFVLLINDKFMEILVSDCKVVE